MISDPEHLFLCLLTICISLENIYSDPLLIFQQVLLLFISFVMLSCMNYMQINHWYILDINPLSVYNLKYLILFRVNDHLILLIIFFAVQRLFFVIFWCSYICLILIFIYFRKTHPWNKTYLIMVHYPFSESESCSVVSDHLRPYGLYSPWNSPDQNTEVSSLSLLQGSPQPRDQTQVSLIAGGFFTSWATREVCDPFNIYF